uniref:Secreted protein n=1 Tax=Globodera rostochiensis TaxID=31243 RepID=A0A914H9W2_GLORO
MFAPSPVFVSMLVAMLFLSMALPPSSVSAAPFDQFSSVVPATYVIEEPSPPILSPYPKSLTQSLQSPLQLYALQRRSLPQAYANRRSAHPCRWKLCGAYHNYSSLRRFLNLENNGAK